MLPQTVVIYGRNLAVVDDIGGELGRKRTLEKSPVDAVPENLVKNPLVVRRIKTEVPM
jgi:hypothetical protein